MSRRIAKVLIAVLAAGVALRSDSLLACAACYGKSDSPLAEGMNWGIFSLLGVVVCVLSAFAAFGIYLARRSAAVGADAPATLKPETLEKV